METAIADTSVAYEAIQECDELLEQASLILFEIEKSGFAFNEVNYHKIFRYLHSVKGCLAMVGLNDLARVIHEGESQFRQCLEQKTFPAPLIQSTLELIALVQDEFKIFPEQSERMKRFQSPLTLVPTSATTILKSPLETRLTWKEEYSTGVESIDLAHQHILNIFRTEINNYKRHAISPYALACKFSEILSLLKMHFEAEASTEQNTTGAENHAHHDHHRAYFEKMNDYQSDLIELEINPSLSILMCLARELLDHLMFEAKLFKSRLDGQCQR